MDRQAIDALLLRFKTQGGKFPELARALGATRGLFVVYPPDQLPPQEPIAMTGPQGAPLAAGFSHDEHATAFAQANGLCNEAGICVTGSSSWRAALRRVLTSGFAGLLLDVGTPHMLMFQDPQVRKLYAYLSWDALVAAPSLQVLSTEAGPFLLRRGPNAQASIAFDELSAAQMCEAHRSAGHPVQLRSYPLRQAIELLLSAGVNQAAVNDGCPDYYVYAREELETLRAVLTD